MGAGDSAPRLVEATRAQRARSQIEEKTAPPAAALAISPALSCALQKLAFFLYPATSGLRTSI